MPSRKSANLKVSVLTVFALAFGLVHAQPIESGAQLHAICKVYAVEGAKSMEASRNAQDPCRQYLVGYLSAFKAQYDQGQAPVCVRMPDTLTFLEFAQRIVAYGDAEPQALQKTATMLAQDTLARDFPCSDKPR